MPMYKITNQNSLFRSRDWLSANQGPAYFIHTYFHQNYCSYRGKTVVPDSVNTNLQDDRAYMLQSILGGLEVARLDYEPQTTSRSVQNNMKIFIALQRRLKSAFFLNISHPLEE
eukprot:sb/3476861/